MWHGLSRFALLGLIGGLASACNSETMRLSDAPFSNPFNASARGAGEPQMTGSVASAPTAPVQSAPLGGSVQSQPLPVARTVPAAPIPHQPRLQASSAPAGKPAATAAARGPGGWTATGGTAVMVGAGDSLTTLADRYGVPGSAILQANGLTGASQVTSGRRIVIPVYNAAGAPAAPSQKVASLAPVAPAAAPRPLVPAAVAQPKVRLVEAEKPVAARQADTADASKRKVRPGQVASKQSEPAPVKAAPAPQPMKTAKAEPEAKPAKPAKLEPAKVAKAEPAKATPAKAKPDPQTVAKAEPAKATKPEPQKIAKVEAAKVEKPEGPKPAKVEQPKVAKTEAPAKPEAPAKAPEPAKVAAVAPSAPPKPEAPKPVPAKEPEQTASVTEQFRWPAKGRVISGFGSGGGNEGINIAVPEGTPVKAAEDGTVTYAGSEVKGYGKLVLIKHDNGYVSAYAHNGDIAVKSGEKVKRGQVVAKSGQSGNVTSPQLHFELRKGATPVDPIVHLASN